VALPVGSKPVLVAVLEPRDVIQAFYFFNLYTIGDAPPLPRLVPGPLTFFQAPLLHPGSFELTVFVLAVRPTSFSTPRAHDAAQRSFDPSGAPSARSPETPESICLSSHRASLYTPRVERVTPPNLLQISRSLAPSLPPALVSKRCSQAQRAQAHSCCARILLQTSATGVG